MTSNEAEENHHEETAASSSSSTPVAYLPGTMRAGALAAFEECNDALVVYRHALEKRTTAPTTTTTTIMRHKTTKNQAAFTMAMEELVFQKLQEDSQWLEQLLSATKESLAREGKLNILMDEVERKLSSRAREDEILSRARELPQKLERMRRGVREERAKRAEEEAQLKKELLRLQNEKKRLEVLFITESEYVDAWLDSRREQQKLDAEVTRRRLTDEHENCNLREEHEKLLHLKLEAFLRQSIEYNEKEAQNWTKRRLDETRSYELKIHALREGIDKKRSELEKLRQEYESRQEFIDNCLAEREAERRRLELEEHKRSRAVKIQAWWRGVMVRRKLGPYRPEEKRRKRPGKPKK